MHVYLLYEDSPLQEAGTDDSPQKFMDAIPLEFHPVTFLYDRLVLGCNKIFQSTASVILRCATTACHEP